MKRILFSSTIAATLLCSTSHILAADYDYGVVTKSPAETYTDVEFGSGWYLRGDITFNSRGKSESTIASIGEPSVDFGVQADYDDVVGAKVGFGYQFNPYLRMDTTMAGSAKSDFNGIRSQTFGGAKKINFSVPVTTTGQNSLGQTITTTTNTVVTDTVSFTSDGKVTSTTQGEYNGSTITPIYGTDRIDASYNVSNFMTNAYLDLPINDKITPYVGAGAGFARISYSEKRQLNCNANSDSACSFPSGDYGEKTEITVTRDEEYWAFAYQLSVGTAIQLTDRTSIDLGYTYMNVDGGDELSYDNGLAINEDGFAIHQGSIGLRYDIN